MGPASTALDRRLARYRAATRGTAGPVATRPSPGAIELATRLAAAIDGEVVHRDEGLVVRAEPASRSLPIDRVRLATLPGQPPPDVPLVCLDTETTGLATAAGTVAFLIGLGWWEGPDRFRQIQLLLPEHAEERALLGALAAAIPPTAWLVTYNGRGFDWPLLVARYRLAGHPPPAHAGHLDLLPVVRRLFRHRMPDARLRTAEAELLGLHRHGDVDGGEIPERYFGFLRGGPAENLVAVVRHNDQDVRSLARLLGHLDAALGDAVERAGAPAGDLGGLARAYARERRLAEALACLELAAARDEVSPVRSGGLAVAEDALLGRPWGVTEAPPDGESALSRDRRSAAEGWPGADGRLGRDHRSGADGWPARDQRPGAVGGSARDHRSGADRSPARDDWSAADGWPARDSRPGADGASARDPRSAGEPRQDADPWSRADPWPPADRRSSPEPARNTDHVEAWRSTTARSPYSPTPSRRSDGRPGSIEPPLGTRADLDDDAWWSPGRPPDFGGRPRPPAATAPIVSPRSAAFDAPWTAERISAERAHVLRRLGRYADAVEAWEALAAGPSRLAIVAAIELAKLHEHRLRDRPAAIAATTRGLAIVDRRRRLGRPEPALEADLHRRLARLHRRRAGRAGRPVA